MPRNGKTYTQLIKMAKQYGVDKNALFIQAAEQYSVQSEIIQKIKSALQGENDLLTEKEYVKGRENIYVNPLVRELPKHADSATKSLGAMLDIIEKLGKPAKPDGKLTELMKAE